MKKKAIKVKKNDIDPLTEPKRFLYLRGKR